MTARRGAVLVTGASSGIGEACCRLLVSHGFGVFAGVRQLPAQRKVAGPAPGAITPIRLDVTSDDSIQSAVNQLRSALPGNGLVGVVNCAGMGSSGPLEYLSRASLAEQFDLNVLGQLMVIQAVLPLLRVAGGRVVNVGSTSGRIPGAFNGGYSASKFALESITSVLRAELATSGVKVSMVEPGVIATGFWDKLAACEERLLASIPEEGRERYAQVLLRRQQGWARLKASGLPPAAVADAVLHALCADRPRRRYVVGRSARAKLLLWKYLPEALRDRIMMRALRS
jgi:NAD(P)-dependent dehydrogenase (short-subunit alcohol dehydrogenase family)